MKLPKLVAAPERQAEVPHVPARARSDAGAAWELIPGRMRSLETGVTTMRKTVATLALVGVVVGVWLAEANVRYWAASALKRLGREAAVAVPELRRALKTFPGGEPALEGPQRYFADVRAVAAEALGSMGAAARQALPDLQEATQDQNELVRDAASTALKAIAP